MTNKYQRELSYDVQAINSDWQILGKDFQKVGDDIAEYMVGTSALFGIPVSKEAIQRVKQARNKRTEVINSNLIDVSSSFSPL
jgi:hypothetical protein